MFKDLRNLVKHSSIYTIGNVLTKAIALILIPIYTKHIAVEAFGIYSLFEITSKFLIPITLFGLVHSTFRWFSLSKKKIGSIIFTNFSFSIFVSAILLILINLIRDKLSILFFSTEEYSILFLLIIIISSLTNLDRLSSVYLRFEEKSILFISSRLVNFILHLTTTIYLIVFLHMGIEAIFIGQIVGLSAALLIKQFYIFDKLVFRFELKELKNMIKFGAPLMISSISNNILNIGDRYILSLLTNMKVVGIYALGYKFANLIKTLFIGSFFTAFRPAMWKKIKDSNSKRFQSRLLTYYLFIIMWLSLFIAVYAKGIIHNFALNSEYWDAYKIVGIVVFSISIKGTFSIFRMGLEYTNKTKLVPIIVYVGGFFNIGLNFLLIPNFKMMGAAAATLISFVLMVNLAYYFSNKYYPIKFKWIRVLKILFITSTIYFISYLLNPLPLLWKILTKFVLLASYPFLLYLIDFYEQQELNRIKGAWKKWTDWKNLKSHLKDINFK